MRIRTNLLRGFLTALLIGGGSVSGVLRAQLHASRDKPGIQLLKKADASATTPRAKDHTSDVSDAPATRIEYLPAPTPEEARIPDLLRARASFQFDNVTLEKFVRELSQATGIDVHLDRRELEDLGIFADEETVSIDLKNVEVGQALWLILNHLELAYEVEGTTLLITSQEAVEELLIFRMYPVKDLMEQPGGAVDGNWLIDLIKTNIEIDSWDPIGPGTISAYPQAYVLVVNQTQACHEHVLQMLRMLRKARNLAGISGTDARFFPGGQKRSPTLSQPAR